MKPQSSLLPLLSLLALGGCGTGAKTCTASTDCAVNQICVRGECRATSATTGGGTGTGGGFISTGGGSGGGTVQSGGGTAQGGGGGTPNTGGGGGSGGGGLIEPDAGPSTSDGGCGAPMPGNPTIRRLCAAATVNECAGATDTALSGGGVPAQRLNGTQGNGFDDDCDGQVDEGCSCGASGVTRDCYLVPATQVDPQTGKPVGWCSSNAKGSLDCAGGEIATWSGVCRGAQPPQLVDSCASGDFNCDGLNGNNANEGCMCPNSVQCPTQVITTAPYPNPNAIPILDGSGWLTDAAARARTTNWTWTVLGGDCDNVLPNPTFALYSQADSTVPGSRKGSRVTVRLDTNQSPARYVVQNGAPLAAIRADNYGSGVAGGQIFPAFGLSGDYVVQGEFTLDGQTFSCTQKVQVRAPGVRAELCWDTVGGLGGSQGNDIDLHFARLQGVSCAEQGWVLTCQNGDGSTQDCHYLGNSGCSNFSPMGPRWGYSDSPTTACQGWSSKRTAACTNPRLDRDNVQCARGVDDPTAIDFCGPENINLDYPNDGDRFVVGVNHYANGSGTSEARPHVNLYCNGERVVSFGLNPATGQQYPLLITPGRTTTGDFWTVATITAHVNGGTLTNCDVSTIPSRNADVSRDGPPPMGMTGTDVCVDHGYASKKFVDNGTGQGLSAGQQPMTPAQWCKH